MLPPVWAKFTRMKGEIFSRFYWEVFPFRTRFSLWYGMCRLNFNLHSYNKEIFLCHLLQETCALHAWREYC